MSKKQERLEKLSAIAALHYEREAHEMSRVLERRRELERHIRTLSASGHGAFDTDDLALGAQAQTLWKQSQSTQRARLQDELATTRARQERLKGPLAKAYGRKDVLDKLKRR